METRMKLLQDTCDRYKIQVGKNLNIYILKIFQDLAFSLMYK